MNEDLSISIFRRPFGKRTIFEKRCAVFINFGCGTKLGPYLCREVISGSLTNIQNRSFQIGYEVDAAFLRSILTGSLFPEPRSERTMPRLNYAGFERHSR